jgi:hypothetical protein
MLIASFTACPFTEYFKVIFIDSPCPDMLNPVEAIIFPSERS